MTVLLVSWCVAANAPASEKSWSWERHAVRISDYESSIGTCVIVGTRSQRAQDESSHARGGVVFDVFFSFLRSLVQ